jgi:peptidoglycan hydrolase CwlO-like protein
MNLVEDLANAVIDMERKNKILIISLMILVVASCATNFYNWQQNKKLRTSLNRLRGEIEDLKDYGQAINYLQGSISDIEYRLDDLEGQINDVQSDVEDIPIYHSWE